LSASRTSSPVPLPPALKDAPPSSRPISSRTYRTLPFFSHQHRGSLQFCALVHRVPWLRRCASPYVVAGHYWSPHRASAPRSMPGQKSRQACPLPLSRSTVAALMIRAPESRCTTPSITVSIAVFFFLGSGRDGKRLMDGGGHLRLSRRRLTQNRGLANWREIDRVLASVRASQLWAGWRLFSSSETWMPSAKTRAIFNRWQISDQPRRRTSRAIYPTLRRMRCASPARNSPWRTRASTGTPALIAVAMSLSSVRISMCARRTPVVGTKRDVDQSLMLFR